MDENYELNGIRFVWNRSKARKNRLKHGVGFPQAAEAFFDPFLRVVDASSPDETRDAVIGMDRHWHLLFVVHVMLPDERIRLISARNATATERRHYEDQ